MNALTTLCKIFVIAILIITEFYYEAFIIENLWNWFLIPLGLASINFVKSVGLSLILTFIMIGPVINIALYGKDEAPSIFNVLFYSAWLNTLILATSWVFHRIMY